MATTLVFGFPTLELREDASRKLETPETAGPVHVPGPTFDPLQCARPLDSHTQAFLDNNYPTPEPTQDYCEPSVAPHAPPGFEDPYLYPVMNKDERLRLTTLWYIMRDALQNSELLARLQEKVNLVSDFVGWEYCIMGILDNSTYTRVSTVGLPTIILPRRESTCSHTVNHPGGIFWVSDMSKDWRFEGSPHVLHGGLKSYAGTTLLCQTGVGTEVPLGSLCVASNEPDLQLSLQQQKALKRVAQMLVKEVISDRRLSRQKQRQKFSDALHELEQHITSLDFESLLLDSIRNFYPGTTVALRETRAGQVKLRDGSIMTTSDAQNGLWENTELFDELLRTQNHTDLHTDQTVRVLITPVGPVAHALVLAVETSDVRLIFDDVDARYVEQCARLVWLASQQRQLDEAVRAKEVFLRGITHQLRTPIHGILGATELLVEEFGIKRPKYRSRFGSGASRESLSDYSNSGLCSPMQHRESNDMFSTFSSLGMNSPIQQSETSLPEKSAVISIREKPIHGSNHPLRSSSASSPRENGNLTFQDSRMEEQSVDRTPQFLETIKTINSSGKELMSTVNNILKLNRWAEISTTLPGVPVLCDIQQLECDLVQELQESLPLEELMDVSLYFDNKLDEGAVVFLANGTLLRDCVHALVVNAIQWSPKGVVSVTTELNTTTLNIVVTDNGIGIAQNHWEHIFEPYEKVDQHSRGAGLGLTLASKFAEALGGKLSLAWSKPRLGSKFVLELPRATLGSTMMQTKSTLVAETTTTKCRLLSTASSLPHPLTAHLIQYIEKQGLKTSATNSDLNGEVIELDIVDFSLEHDVLERRLFCRDSTRLTACVVPSEAYLETINRVDLPEKVLLFHGPLTTRRLEEITVQLSNTYGQCIPRPISSVPEINNNETAPEPKFPSLETAPSSPVALLVDDNPINLTILRMFCRKRGIPYHEAVNGEQASRIFQEEREPSISLVLMDLQMPVCDGLDATRRIRQIEAIEHRPRCALFMITGQDSPQDRENSYQAGADQFMVKPVRMKALDAIIDSHFSLATQSTTS